MTENQYRAAYIRLAYPYYTEKEMVSDLSPTRRTRRTKATIRQMGLYSLSSQS